MRKSEGETRIPKSLRDRIRRVKLVVFDADGVLTDGTIYLLPDGRELKAFNALDGTGMKYLERAGIATAILSGRRSGSVRITFGRDSRRVCSRKSPLFAALTAALTAQMRAAPSQK